MYQALVGSPTPNAISNGVSQFRVTPDSYHSTLSLGDNHIRMFSSLRHRNFFFWPTLRAFYIHIEIRDHSPGLLHPHRNSGSLPGSLTLTQKFRISHRVSYTLIEILGYHPGSLTPSQKFGIAPRVSYTHTEISGHLPGSLTPSQKFEITPRVSYTHTEIQE